MVPAVDSLHARRAIDMPHSGNQSRLIRQHIEDKQHKGCIDGIPGPPVEPLVGAFLYDQRRHRPEIFAIFQFVQARLHGAVPRRRKNGPGSKRARAELHAALEPPQYFLLRQEIGGCVDNTMQPPVGHMGPAQE